MKNIARRTVRVCCIERNTAQINHHKGFFSNPRRLCPCMFLQRGANLNPFSTIAVNADRTECIRLTVENLAAKEIHADEFSNIRGTWILQQVLLASLLNHTAMIEHQDALSKKLAHTLSYSPTRHSMSAQPKAHVLKNAQVRKQRIVLKDITKWPRLWRHTNTLFAIKKNHAIQSNAAPFWMQQTRQQT